MPASSDEQLVSEALGDSHLAFERLVKKYQPRVLRTIASIISDEQAAQDVAQETFLSAWSNLAKLKEQQKFGRWLTKIAINSAKLWLRDQQKHRGNAVSLEDNVVVWAQERINQREKLRQEVWEAIDELPTAQREVVVLHYISGYSYKEISGMLSVPVSTISGRLQKAKNQLRKEFLDMVTKLQLEIDSTLHGFLTEHAKQNDVSIEGLIIRLIERYKIYMDSPKMAVRKVWDSLGLPSSDGRYLAFVNWKTGGNLAIRDLTTGESRDITDEASPLMLYTPCPWRGVLAVPDSYRRGGRRYLWAPDGKQIAYLWWDEDHAELRIIRPDGSEPRVLCRNLGGGELYDWSENGKSILARFVKPIGPKEIVNEIVLVSVADGSMSVLRTPTVRPIGMSLSPDGRYVVYDRSVKEHNEFHRLFMLDIHGSGEEIPLLEHSSGDDYYPVWAPDGKTIVFVSNRESGDGTSLWIMPVVDGKLLGEPQLVKRDAGYIAPMRFTRNGSLYYTSHINWSDIRVASVDMETGEILEPPTTIRSEGFNRDPFWAPDGKSLGYMSRRGSPEGPGFRTVLVLRSMETGRERELLHEERIVFGHPWSFHFATPRWSPDGHSILFRCHPDAPKENQGEGIHLINIQTGHVTTVVERRSGESFCSPQWSPDGKALFYHRRREGRGEWPCSIVRHELETGQEREIYQGGSFGSFLAVSPDGRQLAFSDEDRKVLKAIPTEGGEPRELFSVHNGSDESIEFVFPSAWTPDGRHLLFAKRKWSLPDDSQRWRPWPRELWRIPAEGGEPQKLLTEEKLGGSLSDTAFHPDGHRIAIKKFRAGRGELWVIENLLSVFTAGK